MLLQLLAPTATDDGRAFELLRRERAGIEVSELAQIQQRYGLSDQNTLALLTINARTLQRRRSETKRLNATESATLLDIGRLLTYASAVFGEDEKAKSWLSRPNKALNQETPLTLLSTSTGRGLVRDVLGRIEHGVFV